MKSEFRTAGVYLRSRLAGLLQETDSGYTFTYMPDFLADDTQPAVSLTLPKRAEPYQSSTLFSFFDGLIPEGWLLDLVVQNWRLNPRDRFGLLLVACRDCIGAVHIEEVQ